MSRARAWTDYLEDEYGTESDQGQAFRDESYDEGRQRHDSSRYRGRAKGMRLLSDDGPGTGSAGGGDDPNPTNAGSANPTAAVADPANEAVEDPTGAVGGDADMAPAEPDNSGGSHGVRPAGGATDGGSGDRGETPGVAPPVGVEDDRGSGNPGETPGVTPLGEGASGGGDAPTPKRDVEMEDAASQVPSLSLSQAMAAQRRNAPTAKMPSAEDIPQQATTREEAEEVLAKAQMGGLVPGAEEPLPEAERELPRTQQVTLRLRHAHAERVLIEHPVKERTELDDGSTQYVLVNGTVLIVEPQKKLYVPKTQLPESLLQGMVEQFRMPPQESAALAIEESERVLVNDPDRLHQWHSRTREGMGLVYAFGDPLGLDPRPQPDDTAGDTGLAPRDPMLPAHLARARRLYEDLMPSPPVVHKLREEHEAAPGRGVHSWHVALRARWITSAEGYHRVVAPDYWAWKTFNPALVWKLEYPSGVERPLSGYSWDDEVNTLTEHMTKMVRAHHLDRYAEIMEVLQTPMPVELPDDDNEERHGELANPQAWRLRLSLAVRTAHFYAANHKNLHAGIVIRE